MSTISAQCDELRSMAASVGLEVPQAATLMMGAADAIDRLDAENDRLRELVRDMMRFFEDGSYCTTCEKVAECDASEIYECDCLMRSVFKGRMRELGVEVDG